MSARLRKIHSTLRERQRWWWRLLASREDHCLRDRLDESELLSFEKSRSITLPDEYRSFLLQVSNGGPGPGNGLFSLREGALESKQEKDFPWSREIEFETDAEWEAWDHEHPGVLYLGHMGCGDFGFLVVRGDAVGNQVWADLGGSVLRPTGIGFLDWYEGWLGIAG